MKKKDPQSKDVTMMNAYLNEGFSSFILKSEFNTDFLK